MLLFNVINPCLNYPYEIDVKLGGEGDAKEKIQRFHRNGKKPEGSTTYHQRCQTEWLNLWNAYEACTHINSLKRPDVLGALKILTEDVQGGRDLYRNAEKENTHLEVQASEKTSDVLREKLTEHSQDNHRSRLTNQLGKDNSFHDQQQKVPDKERKDDVKRVEDSELHAERSQQSPVETDTTDDNSHINDFSSREHKDGQCTEREMSRNTHLEVQASEKTSDVLREKLTEHSQDNHRSRLTNQLGKDNSFHDQQQKVPDKERKDDVKRVEDSELHAESSQQSPVETDTTDVSGIVIVRLPWEKSADQRKDNVDIVADNHTSTISPVGNIKMVSVQKEECQELEEDEREEEEPLKPVGIPYKEDVCTPVYSWSRKAYSCKGLVRLLLQDYEPEFLCISQPVNVAHNVSFLVGNCMMKNKDDLKCDDMGVWKRTGSPKIVPLQGKPGPKDDNVYQLRRIYYVNGSDRDVRKVISTLQDNKNRATPYTFIQYLFKSEEHEISNIRPHGTQRKSHLIGGFFQVPRNN
ncbi:hypothetical protein OS493_030463 [Desmophyllum pertusum]|uniref:Uncharacterized protein n=1 Tax=Desmophyllum pertusum TaxID=174260 RepID=A0A9W9YWF2_9CNID|nr:hypothetical protein OS493_030463 [Desmophyllum pertusum]